MNKTSSFSTAFANVESMMLCVKDLQARSAAKPMVVILGATGTGKSKLAVEIADRFHGEIINADAMQMYEGLPVVTNKPSQHERAGVAHHLLGLIPPSHPPWTVGKFLTMARSHIDDIHARGRLPILVGGTHYYLQSLLFTSTVANSENNELTMGARVTDDWRILDADTPDLYAELSRIDPEIAKRWHPNDRRKIRRSLEIYLQTGSKASQVYKDQRQKPNPGLSEALPAGYGKLAYNAVLLWAHTERETLIKRLDSRVDSMVAKGLLDEVKQLGRLKSELDAQGNPVDMSKGIWVSIGFKEFQAYLESADAGASEALLGSLMHEAIDRTKTSTRQYAKRQVKWIRSKLLSALENAEAVDCMHLVETDDPDNWQETVSKPVTDIISSYLSGRPVSQALRVSKAAHELLTVQRGIDLSNRPELWVSKKCDLCGVIAVTESEWKAHVQGRSHRSRLRKHANMSQLGVETTSEQLKG